MDDVLVLDKVSADRGSVRILHDVSVSVGNETLAIFGLNGSGKSTLLRVMSGLRRALGIRSTR
jgi:ABC-type Mn2+/Zn2+ transport system ATPase subunit